MARNTQCPKTYKDLSLAANSVFLELKNSTLITKEDTGKGYGHSVNSLNKAAKVLHQPQGKGYSLTERLLNYYQTWDLTMQPTQHHDQYMAEFSDEYYRADKRADIQLITELSGNLSLSRRRWNQYLEPEEDYVITTLMKTISSYVQKMQQHPDKKIRTSAEMITYLFLDERQLSVEEIAKQLQITKRAYYTLRENAIQHLSSLLFGGRLDVFWEQLVLKNGIPVIPEKINIMKLHGLKGRKPKITEKKYLALQNACFDMIETCLDKCEEYHQIVSSHNDSDFRHGLGYETTKQLLRTHLKNKNVEVSEKKVDEIRRSMADNGYSENTSFCSDGSPVHILPSREDMESPEADRSSLKSINCTTFTQAQVFYGLNYDGSAFLEKYGKTTRCFMNNVRRAIVEEKIDAMMSSGNKKFSLLGKLLHTLYIAERPDLTNRNAEITQTMNISNRMIYEYRQQGIELLSMMLMGFEPGTFGLTEDSAFSLNQLSY